jgi:hypothetical protein
VELCNTNHGRPDESLGRWRGRCERSLSGFRGYFFPSISHALEEPIQTKKIEERLSRHLTVPGMAQTINEQVAAHAAARVRADTLIIVDPTDVRKRYAERMPYLARVRDGSAEESGNGYWGCMAVACEVDKRRVIPLHQRLWSAQAPDFVSENAQLLEVTDAIRGPTQGRGIHAMDRGGDRMKLLALSESLWVKG